MSKIKTISLIDIARSGSFGPIVPQARLSTFAEEIGPPSRWGAFSGGRSLSCLMVFGEVEVGLVGGEGDLLVTWAKINLARFTRSYMKFGCSPGSDFKGSELRIHNPFGRRYPHYDLVAKRMKEDGLKYSTDMDDSFFSDTTAVMRFGPVTFCFTVRPGQPLEAVYIFDRSHVAVKKS
jgi:hypothetical protein